MRQLYHEEYKEVMSFFSKKQKALAEHEGKNSYYGNIAINSCFVHKMDEHRCVYRLYSPEFRRVIAEEYEAAVRNFQQCFGNGDGRCVLKALYRSSQAIQMQWNVDDYIEYLTNEKFCFLIEKVDGAFTDKCLRIDLVRQLDKKKTGQTGWDITGGLFHSLKHFSLNGTNLSTNKNELNDIYDIEYLIWPVLWAFFCEMPQRQSRMLSYFRSMLTSI